MNGPIEHDGSVPRGRGLFRWLFEDRRNGRVVVAQAPNLLLWLVVIAFASRFVSTAGYAAAALRLFLIAALFLWAADEMVRGVNPWRRILGVVTIVFAGVWFGVLGH